MATTIEDKRVFWLNNRGFHKVQTCDTYGRNQSFLAESVLWPDKCAKPRNINEFSEVAARLRDMTERYEALLMHETKKEGAGGENYVHLLQEIKEIQTILKQYDGLVQTN